MSRTPTTLSKLASEVLGTFVLVFFGCGAALMSGGDYVATGLTFGLTVVVMAYAVGRISGGHFNPAVTIGAAVGGRLPWREVGLYIGSQLAGGVLAGLSLWILMHGFEGFDSTTDGLAQNGFGDAGSGYAWWAAFLLEALLTAVFLLVILAVTDSRNEHPVMAPLAIGLALAMVHFASMGATGTSVNPARSIGVGLFAGTDSVVQLWLFIVAPLVGAAAAGLLYPLLFGGDEPVPGSGLRFLRAQPGAVPGYGAPDQYQQQWNQPDGAQFGQQPPYQGHYPQGQQPPGQGQQGYPRSSTPRTGTSRSSTSTPRTSRATRNSSRSGDSPARMTTRTAAPRSARRSRISAGAQPVRCWTSTALSSPPATVSSSTRPMPGA